MELREHTLISAGVMDILMAAKDMDEHQFQRLLALCLQTQAWCVREEYNRNLLLAIAQAGPLTDEIIKALLDTAVAERTEHATKLSAFATSLLADFTKH